MTLTSRAVAQAASGVSRPRPTSVPALAKNMSTRSSSATAASTSRVAPASDAQSPTTATAPSPVATTSTAGSRSASTSRNPSAASRLAMARPIPPAAPVTTAVEPDAYTSDAARHGEPAIEDERLPGDPGGVGGQEVGDGAGHVGRLAKALERVGSG